MTITANTIDARPRGAEPSQEAECRPSGVRAQHRDRDGSIRTTVRLKIAYSASSQLSSPSAGPSKDGPEEDEGDAVEHVAHLLAELVEVLGVAPERQPEGHPRDERRYKARSAECGGRAVGKRRAGSPNDLPPRMRDEVSAAGVDDDRRDHEPVEPLADPPRDARLGDNRLPQRGVGRRQHDRQDDRLFDGQLVEGHSRRDCAECDRQRQPDPEQPHRHPGHAEQGERDYGKRPLHSKSRELELSGAGAPTCGNATGLSEAPGAAALPPVAPVVATVRAPIVTVLCDRRGADDRSSSRDRTAS